MSDTEEAVRPVHPRWPEILKTASENTALSLEMRRACLAASESLAVWKNLNDKVVSLTKQLEEAKARLSQAEMTCDHWEGRFWAKDREFLVNADALSKSVAHRARLEEEIAKLKERPRFYFDGGCCCSPVNASKNLGLSLYKDLLCQLVRNIESELSCRIEHGAHDGGHLKGMQDLIAKWKKELGVGV